METYSFSKIKCFMSCPLCFYKKYFEKPEEKNPKLSMSHGMSEFGSFSHEILEKYEKGELEIYEMLPFYKEHYDENVVSDFSLKLSEDYYRDFSVDYYRSGERYFKNFKGFNEFKILEAEYDFEENIGNKFKFIGKIDLIAEDKFGNLIVIDHKSKSKFKNKTEQKEYAKQLYLYTYAVYKKYKKFPKTLMFNMFRKEDWVKIDFNIKDYVDALKWAIDMVEEIESTFEFIPQKDTFYCWNFCSYRQANFPECKGD